MVKANYAQPVDGYTEAQDAYDALYYDDSETDDPPDSYNHEPDPDNTVDQPDFRKPLQSETFAALHTVPSMSEQGGLSKLGGSTDSVESNLGNGTKSDLARAFQNRHENALTGR